MVAAANVMRGVMPYKIRKSGEKWTVASDKGTVIGTHDSKDSAIRQMVAVSKKEGLMD